MTRLRTFSRVALSAGLLAAWAATPAPAPADEKPALRLRAFAVNMGAAGGRARAGTLDIVIERWSTDADVKQLSDTLIEKGSEDLLKALQKLPRAGYIRTPTSLGWDVHFARQHPQPGGGSRIVIATDRPMSFWELRARPRSVDYEFTLAEIRLGPDGKGEGKLVPAAKIKYDQDARTLQIEDYNTQPVRLTEVKVDN
jgi:hypothetical protein